MPAFSWGLHFGNLISSPLLCLVLSEMLCQLQDLFDFLEAQGIKFICIHTPSPITPPGAPLRVPPATLTPSVTVLSVLLALCLEPGEAGCEVKEWQEVLGNHELN